jgi:hypothetical protein
VPALLEGNAKRREPAFRDRPALNGWTSIAFTIGSSGYDVDVAVSLERDAKERVPVFAFIPLQAIRIDHVHEIGLIQSNFIVI